MCGLAGNAAKKVALLKNVMLLLNFQFVSQDAGNIQVLTIFKDFAALRSKIGCELWHAEIQHRLHATQRVRWIRIVDC